MHKGYAHVQFTSTGLQQSKTTEVISNTDIRLAIIKSLSIICTSLSSTYYFVFKVK